MSNTVIEFNNVGKQYILGTIGTGTLSQDLNRWWAHVRGKEDPFLKIGDTNDRTQKGNSNFVWALRDINFKVEQGDVVGIIGKNGAGKSTLLKILSRVTSPTTGDIKVKGRIASLLEVGTGFHPEMTGRENIFMNGSIMGMNKAEIKSKFDEIVDFAGVAKYVDTPVKRYSSGMIVRLGFAIAAHLEPEILVVDEVLAVGDAEFQKKAIGKMQDVSQGEGRTVLFVSHNMASIKNLCKSGVLLENGMIKTMETIDDVVAEYMSANLAEIGDVSEVTEFTRISAQTKEVEVVSLKRQSPYKMDSLQDIVFTARVKRNGNVSSFQFTTLIDNVANGGTRVGMAYSDVIAWPEGKDEAEFEVRIPHHHLTKGKYILDVWTGIGDATSSCKYYDAVYDTLTFEVEAIGDKLINEWYSYWGESVYPLQVTAI